MLFGQCTSQVLRAGYSLGRRVTHVYRPGQRLLLQYASVLGCCCSMPITIVGSLHQVTPGGLRENSWLFCFCSALGRKVFVGPRAPVSIVASNRPSSLCFLGGCLEGCCCSTPKGTQRGHRTGVPRSEAAAAVRLRSCGVILPFQAAAAVRLEEGEYYTSRKTHGAQ